MRKLLGARDADLRGRGGQPRSAARMSGRSRITSDGNVTGSAGATGSVAPGALSVARSVSGKPPTSTPIAWASRATS